MKRNWCTSLCVLILSIPFLLASPLDELLPGFGLSDTELENFVPAVPTETSSLIVSLPSSAVPFSADSLLLSDPFSLSGRFTSMISVDDKGTIAPEILGVLGIDIRTGDSFRFHAAAEVDLPSRLEKTNPFDLSLAELFADFALGTSSFLRIGKQRGDWGTGRFWERGNLLNLNGRNRGEAPLATRFSTSFSSMHHLDMWLLMPSTVTMISERQWGAAVSYDLSLSSAVLRFAGEYRYQEVSGGMASVATTLGPVQTSLFCVLTYGFPGRPLIQYSDLYYSASLDFSWRTKGRRLFQLSGQFLVESFPNLSTGERVEHGQFALAQIRLFSPWEKVPGSVTGQVRARLDRFVGSWRVTINWNPIDVVSLSFQICGGWGDQLHDDPWQLCSAPARTVQCLLALYVDRQF